MTKSIKYTVRLNTSPQDVYESLIDADRQTAFTGAPTTIENKEGGKFSCYGGALQGTNTHLVEYEKIQQKWRAANWEEGLFSDVTYTLEKDGEETIINFLQTEVPDEAYDQINEGWQNMYWVKMKDYFDKK